MRPRPALLLPLLFLLGCTAELKEENNAQLRTIQAQEREVARLATENARLTLRVADLEEDLRRRDLAASLGMHPGDRIWALLQTSRGEIQCELLPQSAPVTVANFVGLAEGTKDWRDPETRKSMVNTPFYDGTTFHRVIPDFMIQGGDRTGTGRGNAGYLIEDEIDPNLKHLPGTLSMANTDAPDSGGSQFFITEVASPQLDGKHSAFGTCEPLSLIKEIARVERTPDDRPIKPVVLRHVIIHRGQRPL
jgi:cyclophilin family peptidyl-prolyl cis-trans isomerase